MRSNHCFKKSIYSLDDFFMATLSLSSSDSYAMSCWKSFFNSFNWSKFKDETCLETEGWIINYHHSRSKIIVEIQMSFKMKFPLRPYIFILLVLYSWIYLKHIYVWSMIKKKGKKYIFYPVPYNYIVSRENRQTYYD